MKPKFDFVDDKLRDIKENHLQRILNETKVNGPYITVKNKKCLNFCSNDYLGLSSIKVPLTQLQSSSRLVSGNNPTFKIFEKKLARHKNQQEALVFPTGYMANLGSIPTIVQKGDVILSDELNHASIIEACKLSGAKTVIYKHNDMNDLSEKLKKSKKRKFVITEGIFSMDGDFSNLKQITELSEKNYAFVVLDDAHGDFTVGNDGRGTANKFGVAKKIDLYISSLSKGLGSFGGYIASRRNLVNLCINQSKTFIYTSALPSFLVEYSLKKFNLDREKNRLKLQKNVKNLSSGLKNLGFEINSQTHIIPIIIGGEKLALEFGNFLLNHGIFAQPIRYPTVSKNSARIRISVTAWLSKKQIEKSLDVFERAGKKFKII